MKFDNRRYFYLLRKILLDECIKGIKESFTITEFSSGKELCLDKKILKKCQLLFLDINMEKQNGLVTALKLKELYPDIIIVLVTAYMGMIKELSKHIHYNNDYYGYILSTSNLWGNKVVEYAAKTFYPNISNECKEKYGINELIKYIPQELFQLDDYSENLYL